MDDFRIVAARAEDAETIASIYVRTARAAYGGVLPSEHLAGLSAADRSIEIGHALAAMPMHWRMWLAYSSQIAVAFCLTRPSDDEGASSDTAEVDSLYVEHDYQLRGIGRRMLDHAVRDVSDCGFVTITLWTTQLNTRARRFYEHLGWQLDGATRSEMLTGEEVVEVRYRLQHE